MTSLSSLYRKETSRNRIFVFPGIHPVRVALNWLVMIKYLHSAKTVAFYYFAETPMRFNLWPMQL